MPIKVICQSTSEQNEETIQLFNQIRPLLNKGYSYHRAVKEVCNSPPNSNIAYYSWYKRLLRYGETQGYPRKNYLRSKNNSIGRKQ